MRISLKALGLVLACSVMALPGALAQQGSGIKYRVSSKMEMAGMPFAMPAQTSEICGQKNAAGESLVPKQKNCTVHDYRVTGNKSSFSMECTGKDAMTGTGEFEMLGADGYRGKMTMDAEGQQMVMNFEGKRLGECDYAKEGPQAQVDAILAKSCGEMLQESGVALLSIGDQFTAPNRMCTGQKAAYCKKVAPVASDLKAVLGKDGMEAAMRKQGIAQPSQWDTFQACGMSRASILAKDCAKAESVLDYDFIGTLCPDQLAAACGRADPTKEVDFVIGKCPARAAEIAAAHCSGRDFTALNASPYRNFCNAFAGDRLNQGDDSAAPEKSNQKAPKKPSFKDRMKSLTDGVLGGG